MALLGGQRLTRRALQLSRQRIHSETCRHASDTEAANAELPAVLETRPDPPGAKIGARTLAGFERRGRLGRPPSHCPPFREARALPR